MRLIGCDPGCAGALAALDLERKTLEVWDVPTFKLKRAGAKNASSEYDLPRLLEIVAEAVAYGNARPAAAVERQVMRPGIVAGKDGSVQGFGQSSAAGGRQMYGFGLLVGLLAGRGCEIVTPMPSVWKKAVGVTSDKASSLGLARKLFPSCEAYFRRVKDADRAEAALLAYWLARQNDLAVPTFGFAPVGREAA